MRNDSPVTTPDQIGPASAGQAGTDVANPPAAGSAKKHGVIHRVVRAAVLLALLLLLGLAIARPFLPGVVRYYVNRVLDQAIAYKGKIGAVDLHLWRGAYVIHDIRILKATGNVPVPLFRCDHLDLHVQWEALLTGHLVGEVLISQPEINFVDSSEEGGDGETGAGGPWLKILRDLFPFKINGVVVEDGSVHFRTYKTRTPVDVYLSDLHATVSNLTNIHNELDPLVATVNADGKAMDEANFQFRIEGRPFHIQPDLSSWTCVCWVWI